ncbi:MAG: hypothetical protein NZ108_01265, partial [Bacteroidia bacterium]|nr:hypothetical protein [Bacteroidia bacterium]
NGTMVAFCQEIIRDSQLEISYVGFDKAKNRTYSLYHHILLTGVKDAIEIGCHELYLGRTAYEAKAILGCQPILNQNRILISNPFLQVAVKQFFQWFEQQRGVEWKKRNPFRNSI